MSFFTNLRADRLVTEIRSSTDAASPATQKAVARLKELGPGAIEAVFAVLPDADKNATVAFVEVLGALVSQKTFPQFVRGLIEGSPRVISGIAWALTSNRNYPPHLLLEALATPGVSKPAVLEVIAAQKSRFGVRELLNAAYAQEPNEQAALFRTIGEIADGHAAPETIRYLIEVLKDENENARRAAVEVLNEVGNAQSVKYLLEALKDSDWWVRSRAADALGKIGGPKVIEAVLQLVRDKDEDIRRAAIEILNQTKDERAVDSLIQATRDSDWWVSERAIDALAEIGSKRAVPRMLEMLQAGNVKAMPIVIRALGKLGDAKLVDTLLPLVSRPEREVRIEAIQAVAKIADERHADQLRAELQAQVASPDQTIARMAAAAITELENRLAGGLAPAAVAGTVAAATGPGAVRPPQPAPPEPTKTLVTSEATLGQAASKAEAAARLDIQTLKSGDIIEGRYKYIDRIGRGAFGTVLLMEDTVVDERLILKFLNPNVSNDEEVMKRFVHELRYSRKITHKNVIRIYDFLYIQGNYAISMEYFPSHTLGAEVVNEKPLELKRAVQFGMDICTGMTVAHQVGIVHRDLKPANVLINQQALLKIVDFGVAAAHREGDTQLTKTGYVIGSPKYMAPEQILGKKVDERADIYALGVIMYEMVTGVPPYSRGDHMSVMYQHVQGKARVPQEVNPALPPGLSDLVMKAMAVDKAKRFQSMDELRGALERYL